VVTQGVKEQIWQTICPTPMVILINTLKSLYYVGIRLLQLKSNVYAFYFVSISYAYSCLRLGMISFALVY
jgi:hypothetical protein